MSASLQCPLEERGEVSSSRRGKKRRGERRKGEKEKKKERDSRFSRLTFRLLRGFRLSGFYATVRDWTRGLVVHLVGKATMFAPILRDNLRSRNELRRCYFRSSDRGGRGAAVISSNKSAPLTIWPGRNLWRCGGRRLDK